MARNATGKFLRRHLLTVVLAVVPPLGIWYIFQRDNPELSIRVVNDLPIVAVAKDFSDGVEISYKGTSVTNLRVIDVVFENSGNVAIQRASFDQPLTVTFGGDVLGAPRIASKKPPQLGVVLNREGKNAVRVQPMLLNVGDAFAVRTFVANDSTPSGQISVSGRIVGVSDIPVQYATSGGRKQSLINYLAIAASVISALAILQLARQFLRERKHHADAIDHARRLQEMLSQRENMVERISSALQGDATKAGYTRIDETLARVKQEISEATEISVDTRPFLGEEKGSVTSYPVAAFDSFGDLLDKIYWEIETEVDPYEYGWTWGLRAIGSNDIIPNARMIRNVKPGFVIIDSRSLKTVGIRPGDQLEVVRV